MRYATVILSPEIFLPSAMSNSLTSETHLNLHDSTINDVSGSQYNTYHAQEVTVQVYHVYHIYPVGKYPMYIAFWRFGLCLTTQLLKSPIKMMFLTEARKGTKILDACFL